LGDRLTDTLKAILEAIERAGDAEDVKIVAKGGRRVILWAWKHASPDQRAAIDAMILRMGTDSFDVDETENWSEPDD
jgi:hypothetical protein